MQRRRPHRLWGRKVWGAGAIHNTQLHSTSCQKSNVALIPRRCCCWGGDGDGERARLAQRVIDHCKRSRSARLSSVWYCRRLWGWGQDEMTSGVKCEVRLGGGSLGGWEGRMCDFTCLVWVKEKWEVSDDVSEVFVRWLGGLSVRRDEERWMRCRRLWR